MPARLAVLVVSAALVALGSGLAQAQDATTGPLPAPPAWAPSGVQTATTLEERGKYLTVAADCAPCHTAPGGGRPFAGGLELTTPFGMLTSPNLTPDKATGLGNWTFENFYRALHTGIAKGGEFLYPVFPFTSFTKITEPDARAIFAYLQSLEPIDAPRKPSAMNFPFNIRFSLLGWRELFFDEGAFAPDAAASDELNRGAYLVEALAHCGECHSPRNLLGGTITSEAFGGGYADTWFAPNISPDIRDGIGDWSIDQVVQYLRTGAAKTKGTVYGPMQEVVHDSLSKLEDADVTAIAAYLKTAKPEEDAITIERDVNAPVGAQIYLNNCAQCHQDSGRGVMGAIPNLAGNESILGDSPNDAIMVVLNGIVARGDHPAMPSFAEQLDDNQIATVVNYVRSDWGNNASANATSAIVAELRGASALPEIAQAAAGTFSCPTPSGGGDTLPSPEPDVVQMMTGVPDGEMQNRIDEIIDETRKSNPQIDDTTLLDTLVASYCDVLKRETALTDTQKNARIGTFESQVSALIQSDQPPSDASKVTVNVPVSPATLERIDAAAAAAKQTREQYVADQLAKSHAAANP